MVNAGFEVISEPRISFMGTFSRRVLSECGEKKEQPALGKIDSCVALPDDDNRCQSRRCPTNNAGATALQGWMAVCEIVWIEAWPPVIDIVPAVGFEIVAGWVIGVNIVSRRWLYARHYPA